MRKTRLWRPPGQLTSHEKTPVSLQDAVKRRSAPGRSIVAAGWTVLCLGAGWGASGCSSAPIQKPVGIGPGQVALVGLSTSLGRVVGVATGAGGLTAYANSTDTATSSSCTGGCLLVWAPVITRGFPTGLHGVSQSMIGAIGLPNGQVQVTYGGHPLYTLVGETKAGDLRGVGLGGAWFVVSVSGRLTG